VVFILKSFMAPCHASLVLKSHYHRCMSMMVMKSFYIVLEVVVSETYNPNIQTSKKIVLKSQLSHMGIPCSSPFALGGGSIADVGPLTKVSTYY
jgi:hypothetical protein